MLFVVRPLQKLLAAEEGRPPEATLEATSRSDSVGKLRKKHTKHWFYLA
jgi:hypothetical protein